MLRFLFLIPLSLLFCNVAFAQMENRGDKGIPIKEILDIFKKEDTSSSFKPQKNKSLLVFPTFGHQPAYGYTFGLLSRYAFRKNKDRKYSSLTAGSIYSTKKQVLTYFQNNMYLHKDHFFLSGDWRYYIFSQSTFGLGSDIIPSNAATDFDLNNLQEPMNYDYIRFHQTISCKILPSVYVGTGIHIDGYTNIKDLNLDLANGNTTFHYEYSKKHGFNDQKYYVNGFSMNLIYDTRDNMINTNKGLFVNLNYRFNPSLLKNKQASGTLLAETRYFIPLSKTNKQHVLGFWAYGQFLTSGQLPYLNLPAIGWDQNSRSGKGYTQGLIRGTHLAYFESEYRFPLFRNQMISGTVFANMTTASDADRNLKLFQYFQPAAGVGLRILLDKATLTNFIINFGWGRDSKTFYFNDGEGF